MSELIPGKEALIALLSGKEVQMLYDNENWDLIEDWKSWDVKTFLTNDDYGYKFRLKPRTITINGIEVPAPFEPKVGDTCFIVDTEQDEGFYRFTFSENSGVHKNYIYLGAWRTEEEIRQVVAALRQVFGGAQ